MMSRDHCWEVESIFGYSLRDAVKFVALVTIVTSLITIIVSVTHEAVSTAPDAPRARPLLLHAWYFCVLSVSFSLYQLLLSLLLLWQAFEKREKIFICSVWYISHVGIMSIYGILYFSKIVICLRSGEYLKAVLVLVMCSVHEFVFIRFCIIVNSFLHSLDVERYL